ncbi:class IIb bacteriocin, lactobin A/cerein 7B family [Streptococcus sp. sy010]|nr:class IIb bacteriocin, lactobin A/cerein 7B family [Streptococcus sp. sy010]TWT16295.1 class IIb bacteriocin, lactobin A/cerein 7B family [Streptococcus sp. sy010]
MNTLETLNHVNTNVLNLSDQELMKVEGGILPIAVAATIISGSAFAGFSAGIAVGLSRNKR